MISWKNATGRSSQSLILMTQRTADAGICSKYFMALIFASSGLDEASQLEMSTHFPPQLLPDPLTSCSRSPLFHTFSCLNHQVWSLPVSMANTHSLQTAKQFSRKTTSQGGHTCNSVAMVFSWLTLISTKGDPLDHDLQQVKRTHLYVIKLFLGPLGTIYSLSFKIIWQCNVKDQDTFKLCIFVSILMPLSVKYLHIHSSKYQNLALHDDHN